MKKTIIIIFLAALVLIPVSFWFFSHPSNFKLVDILNIFIILLVVAFAVFAGLKKLTSVKRGEPAEDELSKKVMQKAASRSFYISLYFWLIVMYFSDKVEYETHTIIGAGITGMAVIFAITWLVFNFWGIRNE